MKILFLNNNPKGKGTFWRCFGLAKYLVKLGHEVTLICLQAKSSFKISTEYKDGVKIISLPCLFNWGVKELLGHLLRVVLITFFVSTRSFDIVHAFNVAFPTTGLPVLPLWLFKKLGIKKYKAIVDWDDLWGKAGLTSWKEQGVLVGKTADFLETKIPLLADKVTVVSDELKKIALDAGVKWEKIVKIINGADVEAVKPVSKIRARKRLNLGVKEKIVCYAAASVTMNYKFILTAFEKVVKNFKNVRLISLSPLKDWEKETILKSKAGSKVLILDFKPYEEYLLYLAAADVLLMPRSSHILDRCEFPGRLGDFMASARPIVINRAGDAWKIIKKTESGLVAEVDDAADFAQKVIRILKNPKLASRLSKNARKAAEDKYCWEKLTKKLVKKVYEED